MGLAASQARFLGLTARKSNNEYQAQQINQQRLNLAEEQEDFTMKYNDAISNRIMYFIADPSAANTLGNMKQLTYWNIVTPWGETTEDGSISGLGYRLVDADGNIVVPNYPGANETNKIGEIIKKYNVTDEVLDNTTLQNNIESGAWRMKAKRTDDDGNVYWFELPYEEATFISKMRTVNPEDDTDTEYWRLFNTNAALVDGKYQELSFYNLTKMKDLEIRLYDSEDKIVVDELPANDKATVYGQYNVDAKCIDSAYLEEKLRNGEWFIQKPVDVSTNDSEWQTVPWQGVENIYDAFNSEDDAAAESEYEYLLSKFQKEDKLLEMRLKALETEHNALQTEIDSVTEVLKKNVEANFKTFQA